MTCDTIERLISKSLDGEASPEEATQIDAHCARCSRCRAYRAEQQAFHSALPRALGGLLGATRPRPGARAPRRRLARAAAVLALMALSGLIGYALPRPTHPAPPGTENGAAVRTPVRPEPRVLVAEAEGEVAREVVWDPAGGLRMAARVDTDRVFRIRHPETGVDIEWWTTDSSYRLVGAEEQTRRME
jgi:anti-sigma factor RsiW